MPNSAFGNVKYGFEPHWRKIERNFVEPGSLLTVSSTLKRPFLYNNVIVLSLFSHPVRLFRRQKKDKEQYKMWLFEIHQQICMAVQMDEKKK